MFKREEIKSLLLPLLASLTLGLAPHQEPHIIGKIKWISGGAKGMQLIDWFDFAMHSAPWIWLIVATFRLIGHKN